MKTELVKTDLKLVDVRVDYGMADDTINDNFIYITKYKYTFESERFHPDDLVVCERKEMPETLSEFQKLHDITNKELLQFLIKNYK